jgi:poly-beta-1,6-N-acetyl-D-glucosamine synthase
MESFLIVAAVVVGVNGLLWGLVGVARYLGSRLGPAPPTGATRSSVPVDRVAVLIAARDEELVIGDSIASACAQVRPAQVFVASDGSTDETAEVARRLGANVVELTPNRGKAAALVAAIEHFDLIARFDVVLLLDADTTLDADYLASGLPEFDDPDVVAVAGRATTSVDTVPRTSFGRFLLAYRERYYVVLQYLLKYGQAARRANVVSIVPGAASMYRTRVLPQIDIAVPGLVIEDFNMTFEVHAKRLGRIAFRPGAAIAHTQDPDTFADYVRQMHRWMLGFWQTVRRHRLRGGRFWGALVLYIAELIVSSVVLLVIIPLILASAAATLWTEVSGEAGTPADLLSDWLPPLALLLALVVPDLLYSILAAALTGNFADLRYAPAFPFIRVVDAALCVRSLVEVYARRRAASGMWTSPVRRGHGAHEVGHATDLATGAGSADPPTTRSGPSSRAAR